MENYATRDFYLASYLIDRGENYTNVYLVNQNTTEFTFEQSKKLFEYVEGFYTQKALVNPMSYGNTLRSVKSIIHSLKSGNVTSISIQGTINNVNHKHRNEISRG